MNEIIIRILVSILISGAIGLIFRYCSNYNKRKSIDALKSNHVVVHYSPIYFVVGFSMLAFVCFCYIIMILYPNGSETLFVYISFGVFGLMGLLLTALGMVWKIDVYKGKSYFIYRTIYGRKYTIYYKDCTEYRYDKDTVKFKVSRKFFRIERTATNYEFLVQEFERNIRSGVIRVKKIEHIN